VLDVVTAAVGASAGAVTIGTAGATLSAINSITGFKTLDITQYDTSAASVGSLTEGAISIDVSKVTSVTDFKFDGALQNTTGNTLTLGAIAITGEGNAHTFTVANNVQAASAAAATDSISITPLIDNGNNVATLTLTSAGGVTVTGGTATGALAAGGHAINIATGTTSIETFNLISTGTGAEPASGYYNSLAGGTPGAGGTAGFGINAGLNAKIVVTGDHSINVGSINGVAQTVDASGLTANFAVTQTGTANDTLLGGAGKNAITLSGTR
jgi:hypothetical protein